MRLSAYIGGVSITLHVFLPESWRKAPPESGKCVWLLHDKFDDSGDWLSYTRAEQYSTRYGAALIAPSMNSARYNNWQNGAQWETYFIRDLWDYAHGMLPCLSEKREDNAIFGLGRGGCGALKFALVAPEQYGAVMSASYDDGFLKGVLGGGAHMFHGGSGYPSPEAFLTSPDNIRRYVETFAQSGKDKPFVWMAARTGDKTCADGESMKDLLLSLGYEVTWIGEEGGGGRLDSSSGGVFSDWDFCDRMLEKALQFWSK
ncbi:MAG: hypothetical protein IJH38_07560 [Clostridia bacterium]|nr:hypothetical protein [Clostridia bacterium]